MQTKKFKFKKAFVELAAGCPVYSKSNPDRTLELFKLGDKNSIGIPKTVHSSPCGHTETPPPPTQQRQQPPPLREQQPTTITRVEWPTTRVADPVIMFFSVGPGDPFPD